MSVRWSPFAGSMKRMPFSRARTALKLPTGVTRSSQSRGRKAVSPWKRESDRITSWTKASCWPLPKNSSLSGFWDETSLGTGIRRAWKTLSLTAEKFRNVFCPKIG